MKEFIYNKINEIEQKGQLNEVDLSFVLQSLSDKQLAHNNKIYKDFSKILADKFDGKFSNFLKKKLKKVKNKKEVISKIVAYFNEPEDSNYKEVFNILGVPMLEYFVQKTFGKTSLKGKIRQSTPFLKKVSTGNKLFDEFVYQGIFDAVKSKRVQNSFIDELKGIIDDKILDAFTDKSFMDILKKTDEEDNEEIQNEASLKSVKRGARDVFSSYNNKLRWKIVDYLTDSIPGLKKRFYRRVKNEVWEVPFNELKDMIDKKSKAKAFIADILSESVLEYIVYQSKNLYFKDTYFEGMMDVMESVFLSDGIKYHMRKYILDYMKKKVVMDLEKERKSIEKKAKRQEKKVEKMKNKSKRRIYRRRK